jgi:LmbE family N-acetylglucosaminyl deacetylase
MSEARTETLDVIAVGAHPDDVEIACGGTLALLAEQGFRVGIIDLTDGEPTPHSSGPDERRREAEAAAAALGVARRIILPLPNRRLFDSFEARVALATEFRRFRPKVVLGLGQKTPMASPDHWQAMQITDAGVFYSRLTKWDEHFAQLPVHSIPCQLYYPLTFDVEQALTLPHHFTVDISSVMGKKLSAIQCYQSQFGHKSDILERVKSMNAVAGMAAGFGFGELLAKTRALGTTKLMSFMGLEP